MSCNVRFLFGYATGSDESCRRAVMRSEFLPVARRPRRQGGFLLVVRDQGDGQGFHGGATALRMPGNGCRLAGEWHGQAHGLVRLVGNRPSVVGGGSQAKGASRLPIALRVPIRGRPSWVR